MYVRLRKKAKALTAEDAEDTEGYDEKTRAFDYRVLIPSRFAISS
jgi:hypothetical protein